MTKIDQIQRGQTGPAPGGGKTDLPGEGPSFQSLLADAAGRLEEAAAIPGETPVVPAVTQLAAPAAPAAPAGLSAPQAAGVAQGERVLELMEEFLAGYEGGRSLKQLAPLIQAIEAEAQGLGQAADGLADDDALGGILADLAGQAEGLSLKFRRGDFPPA